MNALPRGCLLSFFFVLEPCRGWLFWCLFSEDDHLCAYAFISSSLIHVFNPISTYRGKKVSVSVFLIPSSTLANAETANHSIILRVL
jgi:hypothetical protein